MTSRLSDAPTAFNEITGGFGAFNLEMAPPNWAKKFLYGSRNGRRLSSDGATSFFDDNTEESKLMRSHLFYVLPVIALVLVCHKTMYMIFQFKEMSVPVVLRAPGVEIQLFLALFMGVIDVAAQVLTSKNSALGWKAVACVQLTLVAAFFVVIVAKGKKFLGVVHWEPKPNVRRLRLGNTWGLLDNNEDGAISLDELIEAAPKFGLTKMQATEMFRRLDQNASGGIDKDEFNAGFRKEMVAVELTTVPERLWAYFVQPRRPAGEYTAIDPSKTNMDDPWISLFTSTTPRHVHFLAFRILIMVVEAFVLGGMHGWQQGTFLLSFSFLTAFAILYSPPAVLLAQSRADTIDVTGRFLTYVIYCMIFPGWVTPQEAAQVMIILSALMLIHSSVTQLEPVAKDVYFAFVGFLGLSKNPKTGTDSETNGDQQFVDLEEFAATHALTSSPSRARSVSLDKAVECDGALSESKGDEEVLSVRESREMIERELVLSPVVP